MKAIKQMSLEELEELLDLDNAGNDKNNLSNEEHTIIYNRLKKLDPDTYDADPHLGCRNWPNCDEFGCGEW